DIEYQDKLGGDVRFRDILGIPQSESASTAENVRDFFKNAMFARSTANAVLDEYPTLWENLFGSYASDIEVHRDIPGPKGAADTAMQAVEKVYEGANVLNYLQEFFVRSQEFNYALQLRLGRKGLFLTDVIKTGTIVEQIS